mmetsp:Transcript_18177/g.27806  ORF Transcript_18177/g.27806 Transcript_18177/m.27806 type:complete len:97 (+) Transcript_18177:209-499(+)
MRILQILFDTFIFIALSFIKNHVSAGYYGTACLWLFHYIKNMELLWLFRNVWVCVANTDHMKNIKKRAGCPIIPEKRQGLLEDRWRPRAQKIPATL